jgi:hypothetical protein
MYIIQEGVTAVNPKYTTAFHGTGPLVATPQSGTYKDLANWTGITLGSPFTPLHTISPRSERPTISTPRPSLVPTTHTTIPFSCLKTIPVEVSATVATMLARSASVASISLPRRLSSITPLVKHRITLSKSWGPNFATSFVRVRSATSYIPMKTMCSVMRGRRAGMVTRAGGRRSLRRSSRSMILRASSASTRQ